MYSLFRYFQPVKVSTIESLDKPISLSDIDANEQKYITIGASKMPCKKISWVSDQVDEKKIGFRLLFSGNVTKQPYMLEKKFRVVGNLNNTSTIMNNTFWIGLYPGLTHQELDFVIDQIKKFVH